MVYTTLQSLRKHKGFSDADFITIKDSLPPSDLGQEIALSKILEVAGLPCAIWALHTQTFIYSVKYALAVSQKSLHLYERFLPGNKVLYDVHEALENWMLSPSCVDLEELGKKLYTTSEEFRVKLANGYKSVHTESAKSAFKSVLNALNSAYYQKDAAKYALLSAEESAIAQESAFIGKCAVLVPRIYGLVYYQRDKNNYPPAHVTCVVDIIDEQESVYVDIVS